MKRNYNDGVRENVKFFFGKEVEKTPAFGLNTLFVVDVHPVQDVEAILTSTNTKIDHIFFGANHSFTPKDALDWQRWETMIEYFLEKEYLCSLDISLNFIEEFHDGNLCSYENFIPQIRVPIPYIKLWNYNTMVKIDDKDFKATNPGVWCHSLHKLQDRSKYTTWSEYKNDEIIK